MKKLLSALLALSAAFLLSSCGSGGGGDDTTKVAQSNVTTPATAETLGALQGKPFHFPGGIPDLGFTDPATLTITGTGPNPPFKIESGGVAVEGTLAFGSCIFTLTSPEAYAGQSITIDHCTVTVGSEGKPVGTFTSYVELVLGAAKGLIEDVEITVTDDGRVTVSGTLFGQAVIVEVTGGS